MSFRGAHGPSTEFEVTMQDLLDFKRSVEDGDYSQGPQVFDVPFQIGNVIIDTPIDQHGNVAITLTNALTQNTQTLVSLP